MAKALHDKTFNDNVPVVVSICTITYNHSKFITECIEGFLNQECDFRVEIIIYDDASNDGTSDIIKKYAASHPTIIRPILLSENQYSKGVNPYYSYVFPITKGAYIAICDGDDYWSDPAKLLRQVSILEAEPNTAITYGPVHAFNEEGTIESYRGGACRNLSPNELKLGPPINTLTVCFRNIFKDALPPLFLRNSPVGDLTVWAMLGYHGGGRYIADMPPANYRIHQGGILSLIPRRKTYFMAVMTYLSIAAYHSENNDNSSAQLCLKNATGVINRKLLARFDDVDINDTSFRAKVRQWNRRRKLRRETKKMRRKK